MLPKKQYVQIKIRRYEKKKGCLCNYIDRKICSECGGHIIEYDTEDVMDKALYNFAHNNLITTPSAQPEKRHDTLVSV